MLTQRRFLSMILIFSFLGLVTSCKGKEEHPPGHTQNHNIPQQHSGPIPSTKVVDSKLVCMVTNQYMGSEQIPVLVEGKTYYGCCEGCASKLKENQKNVRFSKDPLTGEEVDKATAYIAFLTDGSNRALYFKSEETYQKYLNLR